MDPKITARNLGTQLNIEQMRARQTPKTDFGTVLKTGLSKTADVALTAGNIAAPFIPGGAVVSAAVSGMAQLKDAAGNMSTSAGAQTAGGLNASGLNSSGLGGGMVGGNSANPANVNAMGQGTSTSNQMQDFAAIQEMSMSQNLQYLQLQQDMQQENRQFTLVSNIMKVKHDTAKNAINNVR